MKRVATGIVAIGAAFAFVACSDDTGLQPDGGPVPDGISKPEKIIVFEGGSPDGDGAAPPPAVCDVSFMGKRCTQKADGTPNGECGDPAKTGMTCLLTDSTKGGVCGCQCTPDDGQTQLVNEDSCPDLSKNVCGTVRLTDGSDLNICFTKCAPEFGKNGCEAPLACNPRSGAQVGIFEGAVCMFFGCEADKDCPVFTSKKCKTDGSVACDTGDECLPEAEGSADGICAKPGKCDTASGLCGPRDANFKAGALVGDACKDSTECDKNQRCERESTAADRKEKPGGEVCGANTDCCSGKCTAKKCEPGLCTTHARNGYCTIVNCAFGTLPEYNCPTGSSCNKLFSGGICMKSCDLNDAATCRGNANDKLGDYECRAWNNIQAGGVSVTDGSVCDFGDTLACNTFTSLDCTAFGEQSNPTKMVCRDLKDAKLTDMKDPMGLCLDDTASGPVQ